MTQTGRRIQTQQPNLNLLFPSLPPDSLRREKHVNNRHIFGDRKSEKKQTKILFCRQTESDPAPDWNVKRRAAGRNRIRGDGAADRLQFGAFFLIF